MSKTIDERIVEMKFDNKQFESGVHQSMSTLDKLKAALKLDGATKGLENIDKTANNIKFDGIQSSIETVKVSFSALEVVAITTLANITNKAVDAGLSLAKSLSVDNISAGWKKYEDKTTSEATLVAQGFDQNEVTEQLKRLNWYTDETSYNFVDMVSEIGKFTAAGHDLETSLTAMEGIANWAAMSGQNASTASRAMGQLSQAMSSGVMQIKDWSSIETANMATAEFKQKVIDAGVALGTLKKNADDTYSTLVGKADPFTATSGFRDSLTKGAWMTSEVMMKVFNDYSTAVDDIYEYSEEKGITASEAIIELGDKVDEFSLRAFKAAQQAKTWTDVVDSVKDAVSTGWMNTFEIVFGDSSEAAIFFTDMANTLWDVFASGGESRNEYLSDIFSSQWSKFGDVLSETGIEVSDMEEKLKQVAENHGIDVDGLIEKYGSFEKTLQSGWLTQNKYIMSEALLDFANGATTAEGALVDLESVVKRVINGEFGNGKDRIKALTDAEYDYAEVQDLVNRTLKGEKINYEELSDEQLKSKGYTEEQIAAMKELAAAAKENGSELQDYIKSLEHKSGKELFTESIKNTLNGIYELITVVREGFSGLVPDAESVRNILEKISEVTSKFKFYTTDDDGNEVLTETGEKLLRTFKGVAAVFDIIGQVIGSIVKGFISIASHLGFIGDGALGATASLGDMLVKFDEWLKDNEIITGSIQKVVDAINVFIDACKKVIQPINDALFGSGDEKNTAIKGVKDDLTEISKKYPALKPVISFLSTIKNEFGKLKKLSPSQIFTKLNTEISKIDFSIITNNFKQITDAVKDFIKTNNFEKLKETLDSLGLKFSEKVEVIKSFVDIAKAKLADFQSWFESKFGKIDLKKIGIIASVTASIVLLFKLASAIKSVTTMFSPFKDLADSITGGIKSIKGVLQTYQNDLRANILMKVAAAILMLVGAVAAIAWLSNKGYDMERSAILLGEIATGLITFLGMLTVLTKLGLNKGMNSLSAMFLSIGISVALLSIALKKISDIDPTKLGSATSTLKKIIVIMTIMATVLSKLAPKLSGGGFGILMFSLALSKVVATLGILSKMDQGTVKKSLLPLIEIMAVLAIISKAASKVSFGGAAGVILLAFSLILIKKMLIKVADPKGWDTIKSGIGRIVTVFAALYGLAYAAKIAGGQAKSAGAGLAAIGVAVLLISIAMKILCGLNDQEIIQASKALAAIVVVLSVMSFVLAFAAKIANGNSLSGFVKLGTMIILIVGTVAALYILSKMPIENLYAAAISLGGVLAAFAAVFFTLGRLKVKTSTFLAFLAAIVVLEAIVHALVFLCKYGGDWKQMITAAASISLVMLAFSASMEIMRNTDGRSFGEKKMDGLRTAVFMLIGVTGAIAILCKTNASWDQMIAASVSLGVLMLALSGTFYIMQKIKTMNAKDSGKLLLESLAMLAPITVALFALLITGADWTQMIGAAAALSLTLLALSGAMAILGAFGSINLAGAAALLVASLSLIPIAYAISMLCGYNWDQMLPVVATLGLVLAELTIVIAVFSALGGTALIGAAVFDGVILIVGALVALAGKLMQIQGVKDSLVAGIECLSLVGEAIGSFIGGIGKGIIETISESFPTLAENLSLFATKLWPFVITMKTIDSSVAEGAASIAAAILALTAAQLINGISDFMAFITGGNSISDLGNELASFGENIGTFIANMGDVSAEKVNAASSILKSIAVFANSIPSSGGKLQDFLGSKNLSSFGEELASFGPNYKKYADAIKDIDAETIANSSAAAKTITEFANSVPNTGGVLADWIGDNTLTEFGRELSNFAVYFRSYAVQVKDIDTDVVSRSAAAAKTVVDFANTIENQGGYLADWVGDNTLADFAEGLVPFAKKFKEYSIWVTGINPEVVANSSYAAQTIVDFSNSIGNEGGYLSTWTGDNKLSTFAEELVAFAKSFKIYYSDLYSVDPEKITNISSAVQSIVDVANILKNNSSFGDNFKEKLSKFGEQLSSFGASLSQYSNSVASVDTGRITTVNSAVQVLINMMKSLSDVNTGNMETFATNMSYIANSGFEGYKKAVTNSQEEIPNLMTVLMDAVITAISSRVEDFTKYSNECMDAIKKAIVNKKPLIIVEIKNLMNQIIETVKTFKTEFEKTGGYVIDGMITGLKNTEKQTTLATTAYQLGTLVKTNINAALSVKSPSREMIKTGGYVGDGLVIGLNNAKNAVGKASESLGNETVSSVNTAINKVSELITNGDVNPVISPVLDLSDVKSKAGEINSLLNNNTLNSTVSAFNSNTSDNLQNGGMTFIQNNYSPKALSRIDIYRQTSNQFAMLKGMT